MNMRDKIEAIRCLSDAELSSFIRWSCRELPDLQKRLNFARKEQSARVRESRKNERCPGK